MNAFQSCVRARSSLDHKVVSGIHGTHIHFLVRKDDDHSVFYINHHLLLIVCRFACEFFELLKVRLSAPSGRIAWINVKRDQIALQAQKHLAPVGAPLRPRAGATSHWQ